MHFVKSPLQASDFTSLYHTYGGEGEKKYILFMKLQKTDKIDTVRIHPTTIIKQDYGGRGRKGIWHEKRI